VADTNAPSITCPSNVTLSCASQVPAPNTASVATSDGCGGPVTVTFVGDIMSASNCPNGFTLTRTYRAADVCGNSATCAQMIVVKDTAPPVISSPATLYIEAGFAVPAPATNLQQFLALGGTASDPTCGDSVNIAFVSDFSTGACPKVITRTYRATDDCGNGTLCTQTIYVACPGIMTDTLRCSLPNGQMNLVFTPDVTTQTCFKLNASTPGQFYYNLFYVGQPGQTVTLNVTVPYPWVTQGAQPVHVYDSVTLNSSGGQTCLTPGNVMAAYSKVMALTNYSVQKLGCTCTMQVTLTVPATHFAYVDIHLNYGLKGTTGYNKNANTPPDALQCGTTNCIIPGATTCPFAASGPLNTSCSIQTDNVFKKNPGFGGLAQNSIQNPVPGATVTIKDSSGNLIGSTTTDADGWYMIPYKYTGKAATFNLTFTPPVGAVQTKSASLKSNGFVEVDWLTP
jgi:hypothetical protein